MNTAYSMIWTAHCADQEKMEGPVMEVLSLSLDTLVCDKKSL